MSGRLLVVSGPSGSGKSSIVNELLERLDLDFSVSVTTRLPRPGERHGVHYRFISRKDFDAMIEAGELLEWAQYNNRFYGTPAAPVAAANSVGRDVLLEIEIQGARQVREKRSDALMFFISPPSLEELETRLLRRGDTSAADIEDRLAVAETEIAEAPDLFDHIIVNDRLDRAVSEIEALITRSSSGNL
ncbi:MAG: guanylate kinase [Actinomycetota bacterium]|nr:guanylate kinase [Actinomycetota bacterium]